MVGASRLPPLETYQTNMTYREIYAKSADRLFEALQFLNSMPESKKKFYFKDIDRLNEFRLELHKLVADEPTK